MANDIIPDDLRNVDSPNKTQDYFLVTLNDLNPNQKYDMQFAWVYEDKSISDWSATYSVTTPAELVGSTPDFIQSDLSGGKGFLSIKWRGRDTAENILTGIKQVNIWVKGGQYGNTYIKLADSFTSASTKIIYVTPGLYYVKLQVVGYSGALSDFSTEQSAWSLKAPLAASNVSGTWIAPDGSTKSDTLKIGFTFDPDFEDTNTSGKDVDMFRITLTAYGLKKSFLVPVDKSTTSQKFYLSASQNVSNFGIFATSFTVGITTIITGQSESVLVEETSLTYVTPLDNPTITLVAGTLLYTVAWNSQTGKPFDQIYIEEVESNSGTAPTTGWTQVAQGVQNPLTVQTLNANKRWVRAKFYDSHGVETLYSTASSITPNPAVTADNVGPDNVASVTTVTGIDTSGYLGFNGYADITWPAVTGNGIRGYRIRFSNDGGTTYSYVDSPGTGTTYRLGGLAIGSTYKIAVATYDEYNNLSSQFVSATDATISGTPSVSNYISAGNMKFGYGVDGINDVGLYLDTDNYWYLNSSESARLKVGGSTSNYLLWDGSVFAIDGNLTARGGYFKGNVEIQSGGSLFSGVLSGGQIVGAGYVLNNTGLSFSYGSTEMTTIAASTGKLTTVSANIGGWDVNTNTISKNGITLNSTGTIIANKNAYYVGIKPQVSLPTDIVLWAGQSSTGGTHLSGANFRVEAGGTLHATGAVIDGEVTITSGATYDDIATATTNSAAAVSTANSALSALDSKISTGANAVLNANNQITKITAQGISITTGSFNLAAPGETLPSSGARLLLNSAGILGNDGSKDTFVITTAGNATFRGTIDASTITGSTFQTTNYSVSSKHGLKISTSGNGEAISFAYNNSEVASLTSALNPTYGTMFSINTNYGSLGFYSTGVGLSSNSFMSISGTSMGLTTSTGSININAKTSVTLAVNGTTKLSLESDAASIYGGTNQLNLTSTNATLTTSHQSSVYGLRRIQFTNLTSTPTDGATGDIVLVYA